MRQELRIHVQLAYATRDELGELAAEVEHRHGVRVLRSFGLDALRRWRVERLLEVCLDLGVVGGEDPVAGVRRLAVDRAPAIGLDVGRRLVALLAQSGSVRAMMSMIRV
jgi:hypothetical protein